MDWQPIETAPRDGTWIILACDWGEVIEPVAARFAPTPTNPGAFGPFIWRQHNDEGIAERVPVGWMQLPPLPGRPQP